MAVPVMATHRAMGRELPDVPLAMSADFRTWSRPLEVIGNRAPQGRRRGLVRGGIGCGDWLAIGAMFCLCGKVQNDEEIGFSLGNSDERELLLDWLGYLRNAVMRKIEGVSDADARWTPDGRLISLIGIVNHLTHVEWRWIDGGMLGHDVSRNEGEFNPGQELTVDAALTAYRERANATNATARRLAFP
jgi:hypothetical protein